MLKLEYYKTKFSHLPVQGSEDWLYGRQYSFGGSEMASVLEKNKHETWQQLKETKTKRKKLHSDATEWGHLFERVAKHYIKIHWNAEIHEFGSIPHPYYPVCYSPDGLLVIDDELVLLEIKTPIQRGIHKIPDTYHYQVQTGLNVIHAKYALFGQFRFRRCKWGTKFHNTTYDRYYHLEFRKRCKDSFPISYGYFWWPTEEEPLFDLATEKEMVHKIKDQTVAPRLVIEDFNNLPTKGMVLQWKLFDHVYSSIKPNKKFLETHEETLWSKFKELRLAVKEQTIA